MNLLLKQFMKATSLRDEMPLTAAWIDSMREAFGLEHINQQIKAGINGQPTFYAIENGFEVGTKDKRKFGELNVEQYLSLGKKFKPIEKKGRRGK